MATTAVVIKKLIKLKSVLLTSGLQKDNQPLYQVINQLLEALVAVAEAVERSITDTVEPVETDVDNILASTVLTAGNEVAVFPNSRELLAGSGILFDDTTANQRTVSATGGGGGGMGEPGEDGDSFPIPGPQGPTGNPGATGGQGPIGLPGFDGEDGEQGVPGPQGIEGTAGATGATGPPGPIGLGLDGYDGEDGFLGPPGSIGLIGLTGDTGPAGPIGIGLDGEPGEDGIMGPPGPQGPAGSGSGGGFDLTDFTQDLGASDYAGTFDITGLSSLTPDKNVIIVQTMQPISSKGDARDEFELQPIILTGYVVDATTIRALWNCDSVCVGTYAFAYAVSG